MWTSKRKLREEIVKLEYRVADLEERLCPCNEHDWKCIETYTTSICNGWDFDTVYKYKCKRCGKTKQTL